MTHEEYIEQQREAAYAADEAYRNDVRAVAFPLIRDSVKCVDRNDLKNACDGGTCMCDRLAHDIAEQLSAHTVQ